MYGGLQTRQVITNGAVVMSRRRRRWTIGLTVFLLIVCGFLLVVADMKCRMRRFYAFAGYADAISEFAPQGLPVPNAINAIEDGYNRLERRHVDLPSPPWHLRPTYRPMTGLRGGPYLVFIETKPPGLQDWTRLVIFANADGSETRVYRVSESELAAMIAKDDELRRTDSATTTQNAMPAP